MERFVSVRQAQLVLGAAYGLVAVFAIIRQPAVLTAAASAALALTGYLASRRLPDSRIPFGLLGRVCGLGLLVLIAGLAAVVFGGSAGATWSAIVMAYCAGNRLKAAGFGDDGPLRDRS